MRSKFLFKNFISIIIPLSLSLIVYQVLHFFSYYENTSAIKAMLVLAAFCLMMNFVYTHYASKPEFTGMMLVGTVVKLLLTLVGVFVYKVLNPVFYAHFALQLMLYYVLFTIFEIRYLLYLISTQKKHES